jgi:hypothetical protein
LGRPSKELCHGEKGQHTRIDGTAIGQTQKHRAEIGPQMVGPGHA